jgi:hypothetical protein
MQLLFQQKSEIDGNQVSRAKDGQANVIIIKLFREVIFSKWILG